MSDMEKNRYTFIDALRIIACFLVIVNHTNSVIFMNNTPSILWIVSLAYFYISRVAVPIFVMISGFIMLDREDDYKKILKKIVRMIFILFAFSFLYYINGYYTDVRAEIDLKEFLLIVIQGQFQMLYGICIYTLGY